MNKNRRNTNKQSRTSNSTKSAGRFTSKQLTCRASGFEYPYLCTANNGVAGLLSGASATPPANEYTELNPAYFGDRCAQLSRIYNEWRLRRLTIRYRPYVPLGVAMTTYTSAGNRAFAGFAGFTLDPTIGALTQPEVVESGGKEFNFGRPATWSLGAGRWMYVQPTAGDTLADSRFYSLGHFNAVGAQNGPNPSVDWGTFEFHWDVEFRFPIDADAEALSARAPNPARTRAITLENLNKRTRSQALTLLQNEFKENKNLNKDSQNPAKIVVDQDDAIMVSPGNPKIAASGSGQGRYEKGESPMTYKTVENRPTGSSSMLAFFKSQS